MYTVALKKEFKSKHYLTETEGKESQIHTHSYTVETKLQGKNLDDQGYLVNINCLEKNTEKNNQKI